MSIGVPKEIKDNETRVAITPRGVARLKEEGIDILIEKNAGALVGFSDEDYIEAGAKIAADKKELYGNADLIFKVKEPQKSECELMRDGQVIFSYLHLAAEPELTKNLVEKNITGIAFETIESEKKDLPLLKPMSEVAGKVATQFAAFALQKNNGGPGLLLGGATGASPVNVTVVGGGIVGYNSALIAHGMGAKVTILEKSEARMQELDKLFAGGVTLKYSNEENLRELLPNTGLLIGAILLPGAKAPKVITREHIALMPENGVFVDVAIDQGGCSETSRPTTHSNPTYIEEGVIHYCVTNMPAAASLTATLALESSTLPYLLRLAKQGYKNALLGDEGFAEGLNSFNGKVTNAGVAKALGYDYITPKLALES